MDNVIQMLTRTIFRLVGRFVLGGGGGGGTPGPSDRNVSVVLPTFPPDDDDDEEVTEAAGSDSVTVTQLPDITTTPVRHSIKGMPYNLR